jgi:hypothetical protein
VKSRPCFPFVLFFTVAAFLLLIAMPTRNPDLLAQEGIWSGSRAGRVWASSPGVNYQSIIRVAVYNYAHVGRTELEEAERRAANLFANTGDRIVWLDYSNVGSFE